MCKTLIDRKPDIVEPCHLHDVFASVVVDGVVARVAHNLLIKKI